MKRTRLFTAPAIMAMAATLLAPCGSSTDSGAATTSSETQSSSASETADSSTESSDPETSDAESSDAETSDAETDGATADLSSDTKKNLTIPIASGWDEDVAVSNLF